MRTLITKELNLVYGAEGQCIPENSGDNLALTFPIGSATSGQSITPQYEAIVAATSQLIERIANYFN